MLLGHADLVELATDDLVDKKNFLRESLLGEGPLLNQVSISENGQKRPDEKGKKVTDPAASSPQPESLPLGHYFPLIVPLKISQLLRSSTARSS